MSQTTTQNPLVRQLLDTLWRSRNANSKLGDTYAWSLPAGGTCPGQTDLCARLCYAKRGHFVTPVVRKAHARNEELSQDPAFADALTQALSLLPPGLLRLHPSGDFYDAPYIDAWRTALAANPHIKAFAFTRSWRVPELVPSLEALRAVENIQVFASTDEETGQPPAKWRVATMSDLSKARIKKGKEPRPEAMCPQQLSHTKAITCGSCGLCPQYRNGAAGTLLAVQPKGSYKKGVTFARH